MALFIEEKKKFIEMREVGPTPAYMTCRAYIVVKDEIYVGFQIKDREYISHFNGQRWKTIYET